MSFGGGGFGGGSTGGFGGFGSNNATNTTTSGSLFGGNTATAGGFGSTGFGASNTTSPFGAKSTFGAPASTSGGSLFGGGTSTTGGFGGGSGGFGGASNNNANNNTTTAANTGFGASNTGSIFGGGNKPATAGFGATNTASPGLFGSSNTGGGFGANTSTTQSNPFGGQTASTGNPFGGGSTTGSTFGGFGGSNAAAANTNQGTSTAPFTPFTEKDSGAAGTSSAYQSITMQQPYQNKSFEELRLEDYAQNRRVPQNNSFGTGSTFGGFATTNNNNNNNNNTQQGGNRLFGASSSNTTGGFGGSSNTGFGGASSSGFGGTTNTGGNLFGAKPASNTLFGGGASSGTTTGGFGATAGGGGGGSLFGANNNSNTATGFGGGSGGFGSNNPGGTGLFGGQNTTQDKPAFGGGFGSTATTTGTTGFGGFGGANQTQPQQPQQPTGFGANASTGGFGSNAGGGLFGGQNNASKPGGTGLFGGAANTGTTGNSLFGSNNNQQNTGGFGASSGNTGLFGANNQSNTNTGLFGANNQNKQPGTGLFGSGNTGTSGGTGLFGANANTNQGSSLFGGGNQANTGNSLFGNNQSKPAGNSLFGGNNGGTSSLFGGNNANTGNSLFGGNAPAQNQNAGLFGGSQNQTANMGSSLFGNSAQGQTPQNQLTASISGDPYGNAQLFASLASPSPPVGPLATPLVGARPPPKARASLLSSVRGGSPMLGASTTLTPRGRPGYGFSYSNYNSPASTSATLTPGASSLLRPTGSLGSALSSRLSKSFSTSNLRGDSGDGQSLLRTPAPGQSSLLLGSGSVGSGGVRRLKIDRSLRTDLFGDTPKKQVEGSKEPAEKEKEPELRKHVSFDESAGKEPSTTAAKPSPANAMVVREEDEDPRNTISEMAQVSGRNNLSTVPEESHSDTRPAEEATPRKPVEPGEYYTEPALKHVKNMSRSQLSHMKSFIVGRKGVGRIEFGRTGQVDLSSVPLDDVCDKIVRLKPRSATVYEDDSEKPPVGRGLNVPSTIYLEQSWPRSTRMSGATPQKSSQKEIDRHKARLRRVGGTKFLEYDDMTGIWSFTVEHFTTYELDDDDETMEDTTGMLNQQPKLPSSMRSASSGLSEPPATVDATHYSFDSAQDELDSPDFGEQEDTFQFKLAKKSQQSNISLPGGFGEESMANISYDYDDPSADETQEEELLVSGGPRDAEMDDPFIEAAAATAAVQEPGVEELGPFADTTMDEEEELVEQGVPGSFHAEPAGLKSILKPSNAPFFALESPEKVAELPWEEQLQRTLSPKKRDRQALKDMQASLMRGQDDRHPDSLFKKSLLNRSQLGQSYLATKSAKKGKAGFDPSTLSVGDGNDRSQAFKTSMDIMKSLWADDQQPGRKKAAFGENPYQPKPPRRSHSDMNNVESDFRNSFKPAFTNDGTLVFSIPGSAPRLPPGIKEKLKPLVSEHRDVQFVDIGHADDSFTRTLLEVQKARYTRVGAEDMEVDGEEYLMPEATTSNTVSFSELASCVNAASTKLEKQEWAIWTLCSVLFDPLEVCAAELIAGVPEELRQELEPRLRMDAFLAFWLKMLEPIADAQIKDAQSAEVRALLQLTKGDVVAACETLVGAGDARLATIISQLPGSSTSRDMMRAQIKAWRERKDWTEFSDGQRALYSVVAGEVCSIAGIVGAKEDRVAELRLSQRFGLTWSQSLALRVQFGGFDSLHDAVAAYIEDLDQGVELVKPTPWHGRSKDGEDTLLSLLKVTIEREDADSLFDPAIVSGDAMKSRLAWQFATILGAKRIARAEDVQLDALTLDLAWDQEKAGDLPTALWTLLHLNDEESRHIAVKSALERQGGRLQDDPAGHELQTTITTSLKISASLVWSAKALHAQSVRRDPALQCRFLLQAGTEQALEEAHAVLCRTIGPKAVIEREYDGLEGVVALFTAAGPARFHGWAAGGQLYADLVRLVRLSAAKAHGREGEALLRRFGRVLEACAEEGQRGLSLEMKVALIEVRRLVDEMAKAFEDGAGRGGIAAGERQGLGRGRVMLERYRRALVS